MSSRSPLSCRDPVTKGTKEVKYERVMDGLCSTLSIATNPFPFSVNFTLVVYALLEPRT